VIKELDDGSPVAIKDKQALAVDWDYKVSSTKFDEDKRYTSHPSTKEEVMHQELTLKACLDQYVIEEKLGKEDPWYCPKCAEFRQATKKFDLWKLPEYLVIHLKRFQNHRLWGRNKLETTVTFPINGLDLSEMVFSKQETPSIYDLYAVSNHSGSLGGGHYTAYAKVTDSWFCFNDDSVSPVNNEKTLQSSAAYVLFYKRRSTSPTTTTIATNDKTDNMQVDRTSTSENILPNTNNNTVTPMDTSKN